MRYGFAIFLLLTFFHLSGQAQSNAACLDCHDDPEFTMEKNGREISLNINPRLFSRSAHAEVACVECHVGFDADEEPHKPEITPVDCRPCHEETGKAFAGGGHATELRCVDCHRNVHVAENLTRLAQNCRTCHKSEFRAFQSDVHFRADHGATCSDCHAGHAVPAEGTGSCLSCHGDQERAAQNGLGEERAFVISFQESVHGEDLTCGDCHGSHGILPVDSADSPIHPVNIAATCSQCHDDVVAEYSRSEHGRALASGFADAPTCTHCHGEHEIFSITDSRSRVSRLREVEVCEKCHLDNPEITRRMTHTSSFVAAYEQSIHGRKFHEGDTTAAICSDCHGAHSAMRASSPDAPVNKFNLTVTCGNCHEAVAEEFAGSLHAQALTEGVADAPTCTDCHGEHDILEAGAAASPVAPQNVSREVCGPCHSSVRLASKFGLPTRNYDAYLDSYHGLAVRFGSAEVANCASCHGVHNILPADDPRSMIHPTNLANTCGECHPGANQRFAIGKVHVSAGEKEDTILYWIARVYLFLIVAVVGGMFLHNLLDWLRKAKIRYREKYSSQSPATTIPDATKTYERMNLNERIQHFVLMVTFFALVITGFMLKFPDAWWVTTIRQIGGESVFALRGLLHRIAGGGMVGVSLYHVYYVIFTARGRGILRDMRLRRQDFADMVQMLRYNLGLTALRPRFGRFNYIEKAEYWALVWGTVVMSFTGFVLWFENQSMAWFSKLFLDINEVIHYYEAWLAFLAVLVWHIYYVIFNPDVYPMNFTWITGKVTRAEMAHEHPLELAEIEGAAPQSAALAEETPGAGEKESPKKRGEK